MKKRDATSNDSADRLTNATSKSQLVEGRDYYMEGGWLVFTAHYLKQRGYCCESGCRHCPYPREVCGSGGKPPS